MQHISIDTDAMTTYLRSADAVAAELRTAAAHIGSAADIEQIETLAAALGAIGAEFAGKIAAVFAQHAEVLSTAAGLVEHYGRTLSSLTADAAGIDTGTAAAISRASVVL